MSEPSETLAANPVAVLKRRHDAERKIARLLSGLPADEARAVLAAVAAAFAPPVVDPRS